MKNIIFLKKETKLRTCFSKAIALVLFIPMLFINSISAQIPFDCKDLTANGMFNFNTNTSYNVHGYCVSVGNLNWSVSNSSTPQFTTISYGRTSITADKEITIGPDFFAGNFNSDEVTGSFEAKINENPVEAVILEPNSTHVPKYEKLEIGMVLSDEINETVQNYFNNSGTIKNNPFDPDNVNVEAIFLSPSGKINRVNGFYYKEFAPNFEFIAWNEIPTPYHWRLRFSPDEVGTWSLSITVNANGCEPLSSAGLVFYCEENTNEKGYLEVSTKNHRYLRYKDSHDSFFGIGQNIAWPDATYTDPPANSRCNPSDYNKFLGYVHNLGQNQGNLTRVVLNTRWSFGIEFERLGDYRDDESNAPSWELDRYFEALEPYNLKAIVCMQMHEQFRVKPEAWDYNSTFWPNNPYNIASGKNTTIEGINSVTDFYSNTQAQSQFKKYLRYLVARWGYSTQIAYWQVASESDLSEGYSNNQDMYDNWQIAMAAYVKSIDDKHIVSTSYQGQAGEKGYINEKYSNIFLEIGGIHGYYNEKQASINRRYNHINDPKWGFYNNCVIKKPFFFDEIGEFGYKINNIDVTRTPCNLIERHNTIWATAFMGGLGAGLEWWEWQNNEFRTFTFPQLQTYFEGIDFENQIFEPQRFPKKGIGNNYWVNDDASDDINLINEADNSAEGLEAFSLVNSSKTRVYGWVHNRSYYWGNMLSANSPCINLENQYANTYNFSSCHFDCPDDDDDCGCNQISTVNDKIVIRGLKYLRKYDVQVMNTRNIAFSLEFERNTNIFCDLKIDFNTDNVTPDWAYKIKEKNLNNFRTSNTESISYDTLICPIDTIVTNGFYDTDSLGTMNYLWNFGNGSISNQRANSVFYDSAGTYLVTLYVSDSLGFADTLQQYIIVPNCSIITQAKLANTSQQDEFATNVEVNSNISKVQNVEIFPNPFTDNVTIKCSPADYNFLTIFDISGRQLIKIPIHTNEQIVNLQQLMQGAYLIKLSGMHSQFHLKLVKK
jgi:hypothetical protein